jgi:beta-N-acetylhexosaminidase
VLGCAGPDLSDDERAFFAEADPLGFCLFKRNCRDPDQLRRLTEDLRAAVGRPDAPILVDQEGGRVQRLKPPVWARDPAPARIGALAAVDPDLAARAAFDLARAMAADLFDVGIDVDATPVLDLAIPGTSDVIGDRALAADPETIARLGRAVCDGLIAGGVLPVIKHLPGHGRALVDSHQALPVVAADRAALAADFAPFRALADMPWAMTAHVLYPAIDPDRPGTLSAVVIGEVIRGEIGFDGVLVSDDLSMGALDGGIGERAAAALAAGCDLALHCNGRMDEMTEVVAACGPIGAATADRLARTAARRPAVPEPADAAALRAGVASALARLDAA